MNMENIGYQINNGSGWNRHVTASRIAEMVDTLPALPEGFGVLGAPISDKPLGWRLALVKVLPRQIEDGMDDGPEGEPWEWAKENFGCDVEKIYSVTVDSQSEDSSKWMLGKIQEKLSEVLATK